MTAGVQCRVSAALGHGGAHFVEHEGGDGAEVFLREVVKVDDLVDAVEKLRTQELIEGALTRVSRALIVRAQAEAERCRCACCCRRSWS